MCVPQCGWVNLKLNNSPLTLCKTCTISADVLLDRISIKGRAWFATSTIVAYLATFAVQYICKRWVVLDSAPLLRFWQSVYSCRSPQELLSQNSLMIKSQPRQKWVKPSRILITQNWQLNCFRMALWGNNLLTDWWISTDWFRTKRARKKVPMSKRTTKNLIKT